jgi:hypothetical protein
LFIMSQKYCPLEGKSIIFFAKVNFWCLDKGGQII